MSEGYAGFAVDAAKQNSSKGGGTSHQYSELPRSLGYSNSRPAHPSPIGRNREFDPRELRRIAQGKETGGPNGEEKDVGARSRHPRLYKLALELAGGKIGFSRSQREGTQYINDLDASDAYKDYLTGELHRILSGTRPKAVQPYISGPSESDSVRPRGNVSTSESDLDDDESGLGRVRRREEPGLTPSGFEGFREVSEEVPRGVRRSKKVREDVFPWFREECRGEDSLTKSMRCTRNILDYISQDIYTVKRWARAGPGAPKKFPDSEWGNILRGKAVDLHRVLEGQFAVRPVQEEVGRIGGHESTLTRKTVAKRVETSDDWQQAWRGTVEATSYIFPHRREELERYTSYISAKFGRRNVAEHGRIIPFDEAIRKAVGGGENCSLLDKEIHETYWESVLLP